MTLFIVLHIVHYSVVFCKPPWAFGMGKAFTLCKWIKKYTFLYCITAKGLISVQYWGGRRGNKWIYYILIPLKFSGKPIKLQWDYLPAVLGLAVWCPAQGTWSSLFQKWQLEWQKAKCENGRATWTAEEERGALIKGNCKTRKPLEPAERKIEWQELNLEKDSMHRMCWKMWGYKDCN